MSLCNLANGGIYFIFGNVVLDVLLPRFGMPHACDHGEIVAVRLKGGGQEEVLEGGRQGLMRIAINRNNVLPSSEEVLWQTRSTEQQLLRQEEAHRSNLMAKTMLV